MSPVNKLDHCLRLPTLFVCYLSLLLIIEMFSIRLSEAKENRSFIKFLNTKTLEVRNTSEKSKKIRAKSKKRDEDAMLCNTLWSDRRRLITKRFLAFSPTSKRRNGSKLSTKKGFFCFIQRDISLSGENNE